MFTGIIQETGTVESIKRGTKSVRFAVRAKSIARGLKIGASIAVNGCCLTAVKIGSGGRTGRVLVFDLLHETWTRTNFQYVQVGELVNLERSLCLGDRLDGHFVTGHIDGTGTIRRWEQVERDYVMEVAAPAEIMACIIPKGSIALDGISLTIAEVRKGGFRVWIIPHTHAVTNLRQKKVGDAVNLEADLLGKYVLRSISEAVRKMKN